MYYIRLVLPSAIERERRKSNFEHYKDTTLSAREYMYMYMYTCIIIHV